MSGTIKGHEADLVIVVLLTTACQGVAQFAQGPKARRGFLLRRQSMVDPSCALFVLDFFELLVLRVGSPRWVCVLFCCVAGVPFCFSSAHGDLLASRSVPLVVIARNQLTW